jgi:AraC-like DNA-binding protein
MALHTQVEVSLYKVETASYPTLMLQAHRIPHWTLSHVLEGNVRTATRGVTDRVRPGMVMVHPPDVPFDEHASGPGTHQWMSLEADESGVGLLTKNPLPPVVPLGRWRQEYTDTFAALEREWKAPASATRYLACVGGAARLLTLLVRAWEESGLPARPEALNPATDRFAALLAHIDAHLSEKLTRDGLADLACLHPNSLDRAFQAVHGVPPMRFVSQRRLARARQLLETTDDTLDAIALAVGLTDAPRLSRLFRAHLGTSPGALRRGVKSTREGYISPLSAP